MNEQQKTCEYTQTEILEKDLGSTWKCSACNTVEVHAGRTMPYKYCPYCAAEIVKFHKFKSAQVEESLNDKDPKAIQAMLFRLMSLFPGSFINSSNELIIDRDTSCTVYMCLSPIKSLTILRCKVIERLSRAAFKEEPYGNRSKKSIEKNIAYQTRIREGINAFLGVNFSKDDWEYIYTYLGNECNRPLCEKFVDSGYDLNVIRRVSRL